MLAYIPYMDPMGYNRMVDFTFPLQLKGTCLPQKNLDLVYYIWLGLHRYIYHETQSYLAGSLPPC